MVAPPRLPLVLGPTPILKLDRLSRELGVELYVKRDDLTGLVESGQQGPQARVPRGRGPRAPRRHPDRLRHAPVELLPGGGGGGSPPRPARGARGQGGAARDVRRQPPPRPTARRRGAIPVRRRVGAGRRGVRGVRRGDPRRGRATVRDPGERIERGRRARLPRVRGRAGRPDRARGAALRHRGHHRVQRRQPGRAPHGQAARRAPRRDRRRADRLARRPGARVRRRARWPGPSGASASPSTCPSASTCSTATRAPGGATWPRASSAPSCASRNRRAWSSIRCTRARRSSASSTRSGATRAPSVPGSASFTPAGSSASSRTGEPLTRLLDATTSPAR